MDAVVFDAGNVDLTSLPPPGWGFSWLVIEFSFITPFKIGI